MHDLRTSQPGAVGESAACLQHNRTHARNHVEHLDCRDIYNLVCLEEQRLLPRYF